MKSQLRQKEFLSEKRKKERAKAIAWIRPSKYLKEKDPETFNFVDYLRNHRCPTNSQTVLNLLKSKTFAPKISRIVMSKIGEAYIKTSYFDELCKALLKKVREMRRKRLRDYKYNNKLIKLMKVDLEASGCPINLSYGLAKQLIAHYSWDKGEI